MNLKEEIEQMKIIQCKILAFIDKEDIYEEHFQNIINKINDQKISSNKYKLKTLLYLLSKILNNHFRYPNFFSKIEKIVQNYKTEIMNNFTSLEIYNIFQKCPRFLLFLFKEQIIKINEDISNIMPEITFFYLFPQIAKEKNLIKEIPENFEEKQLIGENDDFVSQLIRKDLIDEFIAYVNQNEYSLNSEIKPSIFETNDMLTKFDEITLIKYAAFFGSTQIFKYLYKNGAELSSSLWLYAIHSDNPEMINILEENKIEPPDESYEKCIKESIKCHHNDVTNYIQSNLLEKDFQSIDEIDFKQCYKENIYSYCFHYYNFSYFPSEIKNKIIFYYACQYDYFEIVEYFMNTMNIDIKEKIIILTIYL